MQRKENEVDSDDEIVNVAVQTETKAPRPPKTHKQLEALALGRQKMIERKGERDKIKSENTAVIDVVKSKLKKKDERNAVVDNILVDKPIPKNEPRIVIEEEEPDVIVVKRPKRRIVVEETDSEEEEEVKRKRKIAIKKARNPSVQQYEPVQQYRINFA